MGVALTYPEAWFDTNDRPGLNGHRHEYLFRTLACRHCTVRPPTYQYTDIPNEPLPPRPRGAIVPVYRKDKVLLWMNWMNARMARTIFTQGMFDEYHDVQEQPEPIDTDGIVM